MLPSFKMVGDNIDKEVKPRDMRSDHQARSLHYFHSYGVLDRINLDDYDNTISLPDLSAVQLDLLLPTEDDEASIRSNMCVLMARILQKHLPFFEIC